jgi:hypothetical protein
MRTADERERLARLERERDAVEHVAVRVGVAGALLHGRDRRAGSRRIPEDDVVELDAATRIDEIDGARSFLDRFRCVEHLEHSLEAHHRRHQVDPGVGQAGQWRVHPPDQRGECHQRARRDVAVDHVDRAEPVDRRRAERTDEPERHEEHAAEHRRPHAGVSDRVGLRRERRVLALLIAEQLHEDGAGDVEALGHLGVHAGVVLHLLA